jgi:acetyl esterase/lipase
VLYDPDLDAHVEESRNMNQLVEAFMATVPSFRTSEGLAALRADGGVFASGEVDAVIERTVPGPAGPIPTRCFVPDRIDAVYLDIHGGGWCIGDAKSGDANNWELAQAANVAVLSIDYRLAPEHPSPAGPDDCEAAALWLLDHAASEWGTDRLLIGGASAGAHLSALTLLRLRDKHGQDAVDHFVGANQVFGAYDLGMSPSQRASAGALVIPLDVLEACYANFLPGLDREARRAPEHSPLYADLHGLPPALFTVGTLDPLFDDSLFMAARWEAAGNGAELAVYPESVHGFPAFPTELGRRSRERIRTWVAARAAVPAPVSPS